MKNERDLMDTLCTINIIKNCRMYENWWMHWKSSIFSSIELEICDESIMYSSLHYFASVVVFDFSFTVTFAIVFMLHLWMQLFLDHTCIQSL